MAAPAIALQEVVSFNELKKLAGAIGPCITIATPLPNPLEVRTILKNAVHGVEKDLAAGDWDQSAAGLLEPVCDAAETIEMSGVWGRTLMVLRSPGVFQGFWLRDGHREILHVGEWFRLRPLLAAVSREQRFHLLGISRGNVRLFDCTLFRAEEVKLPASTPGSLRDWLNERQPDHVLDNRSAGGPSTGSMKGVLFGTSSDREKRDEYLKHFFKEIDRGVHAVVREDNVPLVLAGIQEELAAYRRANTYPHLFDQEVHGAPDRVSMQELVERARELVSRSPSEPLRKVLAEVERRPISWDAKVISQRAAEGRIEDLLMSDDTEDERLERAAMETLRHGGRVFCIPAAEMPGNASAMAELRH